MEGNKKVVIDTNLLVRYLVNDDQKKADAVDNLLDRAIKGELKIVVPSVVIARGDRRTCVGFREFLPTESRCNP